MALFKVQDYQRPLFIVAKNYKMAELIWKATIAKELKISTDQVCPPDGIAFICYDSELILSED